jgi:CDP-glycerol glycerophosphotransferase (TagB/SpsB family)
LYCTHGPATTLPFQHLAQRHPHFHVVETGWPKMDPLFSDTRAGIDPRAKLDRPSVLYAPTFSPRLTSAPALRETIARIARTGRWNWRVKFHPKMNPKEVSAYRAIQGPHFMVEETAQLLPLLHAADVLVSDTSSVVAESLMLDTPVVTFRGKAPGDHVLDVSQPDQLEAAIERALARPPELMSAARAFIARMHPYQDGLSSERVLAAVDAMLADPPQGLRPKPANLWRRLQVRHRMRYYRWR